MALLKEAVVVLQLVASERLSNVPASLDPVIEHGRSYPTILDPLAAPLTEAWSAQVLTIPAAGLIDLDLTALAGTQAVVSASGKRPRLVWALAGAENQADVILRTDITNGYTPLSGGQLMQIQPGGLDLQLIRGNLTVIGSTSKLIRITGTPGDTLDLALLWGA